MRPVALHLSNLYCHYISDCPRCGSKDIGRRRWADFWHDLRCWSLRTALYNTWFRVRHVLKEG